VCITAEFLLVLCYIIKIFERLEEELEEESTKEKV
jgi:hypothetical protein